MTRVSCCVAIVSLALCMSRVSAQQQAAPATPAPGATAPARATSRLTTGTRSNFTSTIQGNAINSTNGALPNAVIRLRDARVGQIVASQVSDKSGLFAFKNVEPGNYVVEIMGDDQTVLAASQMISINANEAISVVIKLPFRIPPFAGLLGNTAGLAATVATEAAASSILAVTTTPNASAAEPPTAPAGR